MRQAVDRREEVEETELRQQRELDERLVKRLQEEQHADQAALYEKRREDRIYLPNDGGER